MKVNTRAIIVLLIGSATWAILMYFGTKWIEAHPSLPEARFKIVDSWQGCNVVRYTPDGNARYAYFLDCGGKVG
jgi:hypothetical protein